MSTTLAGAPDHEPFADPDPVEAARLRVVAERRLGAAQVEVDRAAAVLSRAQAELREAGLALRDLQARHDRAPTPAPAAPDAAAEPPQLIPSGGPPPRPGAPAPTSPRRRVSAPVVLLVVGAVMLLSAAAAFVALSWRDLGVGGQALVLTGATATAAAVTTVLRRARLRAATEALAAVTAGLAALDLSGAYAFDLLGAGGLDGPLYTAVAAALLGVAATCVAGATVRGGRGVVTALVTACVTVPVAAGAGAVQIARQVRDATSGSRSGLFAEVVTGPLEGLVVVGLLLLMLTRPVRAVVGVAALRRTLLAVGVVALALAGVLALAVATVLPWTVQDVAALRGSVGVVSRAGCVALVALLLAVVRTHEGSRALRAVAAAVGSLVLVPVLCTVLATATSLPRDVALVVAAVLLVVLVRTAAGRAFALRDGVAAVLVGLGAAATLAVAVLLVLLLVAVEPSAAGEQWYRPARGVLVAAALALVPLATVPALPGPARALTLAVRPRLVTGVLAAAATTVLWQGVLLLPGPGLRAGSALAGVVVVTVVAVLLVRHRDRTGRWRAGPWAGEVMAGALAVQLLAGVLVVLVCDPLLDADGRLVGLHLVLVAASAVVLAVAVTPRPLTRTPLPADHEAVGRATATGVVLVVLAVAATAAGGGLLAAPAGLLVGPRVDGTLVGLALTASGALVLLLRLDAWCSARTGVACLGALGSAVVLVAVAAASGDGGPSLLPDLLVPATGAPGGRGPFRTEGFVQVLAWGALVAHAVAATSPRAGRSPLPPRWRHAVLPGPLVGVGAGLVVALAPLLGDPRVDLSVLPASAALAALLGYAVAVARLDPASPHAVNGRALAAVRDIARPALAGLLLTTVVVAVLPVLEPLPLQRAALPWLGLFLTVVVTATRVRGRAYPPGLVAAARAVVLPVAAAGSALLLLVSLRPLTSVPVEVESLLVTGGAVLAHVGRAARQRARGTLPVRLTLRDLSAAGSAALLGALGVVAALLGDRPLWVAGLTWLLAGAGACTLAGLVGGRLGSMLPEVGASRGWWAVRAGAVAALLGYALGVADLDGPLDRFTVPLGLVMAAFGIWALLGATPPDGGRPTSLAALGPGLAVALAPATLPALLDPEGLRPLVLALAGSGLVMAGAVLRWRAPLLAGLLVAVPVATVQALPFVTSVPQWVSLAVAGTLLLGVGVTFERQRQRALAAGRAWRGLR